MNAVAKKYLKNLFNLDAPTRSLMLGTIIGQLIPLLLIPVLTRIYSVTLFGQYALFLSLSILMSSFAAGKYELAIMVAVDSDEIINLTALSVLICGLVGLLSLLFFVFCMFYFKSFSIFYLTPLSATLLGIYQALYNYHNKSRNYRILSLSLFLQASFAVIISIFLAYTKLHYFGLILGYLFSQVLVIVIFLKLIKRGFFEKLDFLKIKMLFLKYKNFLLFSAPTDLIQRLATHLPVLFISNFFSLAVVGYYSLAQRIGVIPIGIISRSIGNVFFEKASDQYSVKNECRSLFIRTSLQLLLFSLFICIFLSVIFPLLIPTIFGKEWIPAGNYLITLSFLFFFQLIVSPTSVMFYIAHKQKVDFNIQIALIFGTGLSLFLGWYFFKNPYISIAFYVIAYIIKYCIEFGLSFWYSSEAYSLAFSEDKT